jgi:hypothetical protein
MRIEQLYTNFKYDDKMYLIGDQVAFSRVKTTMKFVDFVYLLFISFLLAIMLSVMTLPCFSDAERTDLLGVSSGEWVEYDFDCFGPNSLWESRISARVDFLDVSETGITFQITDRKTISMIETSTVTTSLDEMLSQFRDDGTIGLAPIVIPSNFDVSYLNTEFVNQSLGLGWILDGVDAGATVARDTRIQSATKVVVSGGVSREALSISLTWRQYFFDLDSIWTYMASWDRETGILLSEECRAFGPVSRDNPTEPSGSLFDFLGIQIMQTNLWEFSYPISNQIPKIMALGIVTVGLGFGTNFRRLGSRIRNRWRS